MAQNGGDPPPRGSRATVVGYSLEEGIGVDRAGALVAAIQTATGVAVIVRILTPALAADGRFMRQLRADAMALMALRQRNLVSVLGFDANAPAVISERVDGPSLAAVLNRGGPLVPAAAFVLFDDMLAGLEALHAANVLHRDVRPESVLIDQSGTVMLRDAAVPAPPLRAGWRAGTPQYMAPELWQGELPSVRSDLYAATAVFFEALSGTPPFAELDLEALRAQHADLPVAEGDVPVAGRGMVMEGLAKDPGARPVDATRMRADLATAAGAFLEDDWREHGRGWLVGAARDQRSHVPPPPPPPVDETPAAADEDPAFEPALVVAPREPFWRNPRVLAAIAAALLAVVVIAVVAVAALSRGSTTSSGATAGPDTSASASGTGNGLFSPAGDVPSTSPSVSASGSASPSATPSAATAIPTNSGQVTFTPAATPTPTPTTAITACIPTLISPCPSPT